MKLLPIAILLLALGGCTTHHNLGFFEAGKEERHIVNGPSPFVGMRSTGKLGTVNYVTEVRWHNVAESPHWIGTNAPPLTPLKAETIAKEWLTHNIDLPTSGIVVLTGVDMWRLVEISLRRWYRSNIWVYEVKMVPLINNSYNHPAMTVFIKMDGEVITPVIRELDSRTKAQSAP
jgi:hypothetical protein